MTKLEAERTFALASRLFWRLQQRDTISAALASVWRLETLRACRESGVAETRIEAIDDRCREQAAGEVES